MSKAGRILLLAVAIFAIAGANKETYAKTQANTCSSSLVSTTVCEGPKAQVCQGPISQSPKQIQSAVVIAKQQPTVNTDPTTPSNQEAPSVTPEVNQVSPTMPALNSEVTQDDANLDSDKVFGLVNQYRASRGLVPFEKDDKVCELATTRSNEIIGEIGSGVLHSGLYNRNLPYWIWENAKYGSNEEGTVAWWISSPIHHQSMVGDYKFSCVKCTGSYCAQLFTSFAPK